MYALFVFVDGMDKVHLSFVFNTMILRDVFTDHAYFEYSFHLCFVPKSIKLSFSY